MEWPSSYAGQGSWSVNFWLLFCKLLRGLFKPLWFTWKERIAMAVVEAIYKLKYFMFRQQKKTGNMAGAQGKLMENTGNLVLIGAWQPWVIHLLDT